MDSEQTSHTHDPEGTATGAPPAARANGARPSGVPARPGARAGRPLRRHWYILLAACVLAALAVLVDQAVTTRLTDETTRRRIIMVFGLPAAAGTFIMPLAMLASFPNGRRLCVGFVTPLLLSTAITHVLKWAVGRARPHMNLGAWHFQPFGWTDDLQTFVLNGNFESFPSGHSSAAAALAVLFGLYFPPARGVFYFFTGLIGLERIIHAKHFLSDVLGGFIIGAFAVYACVHLLGPRFYNKELTPPG